MDFDTQGTNDLVVRVTTSFDAGGFDVVTQPLRYSYPAVEIKTPAYLLAIFGLAALAMFYFAWADRSAILAVLGVYLLGSAVYSALSYYVNSKIAYVVDDLFLMKYSGTKEQWRIPVQSIAEISRGIKPRGRYTKAAPRGYIIKANDKLYKITYDLIGALDLVQKLKLMNPGIVYDEGRYSVFGNYKGSSLTREYFWRNLWKDAVIITFIIAAIAGLIVLAVNNKLKL